MRSSGSSAILRPPRAKSFTPLSGYGLWLAEITAPYPSSSWARDATPGGGGTPTRPASAPSLRSPAPSAASGSGAARRGARPAADGRSVPSTRAAARPSAVTSSGVRSRLATPRMPSVPNRSVMRPRRCSALRVLRRLAGLLQAVLAALLLPRVAHEQPGLLEGRTQLVVEGHERARDAETQRAGLAAHAAAVERRVDVVHVGRLGEAQRLGGDDLVRERREVPLEVASVDLDDAGPGTQPDTRDRLLAPP